MQVFGMLMLKEKNVNNESNCSNVAVPEKKKKQQLFYSSTGTKRRIRFFKCEDCIISLSCW
jgi:hypothetical protein